MIMDCEPTNRPEYGTRCSFTCPQGYRISAGQPSSAFCTADGDWNDKALKSFAAYCVHSFGEYKKIKYELKTRILSGNGPIGEESG